MQSQVSELVLWREGEGTLDWVFIGIVELTSLTCSATSVVRPNSPYSWIIQKLFVGYLLCLRASASAKDSQMMMSPP